MHVLQVALMHVLQVPLMHVAQVPVIRMMKVPMMIPFPLCCAVLTRLSIHKADA